MGQSLEYLFQVQHITCQFFKIPYDWMMHFQCHIVYYKLFKVPYL